MQFKQAVSAAPFLAAIAGANVHAGIDGAITSAEYGAPLAIQNIGTGFGNNSNELDAMFAKRVPGALNVGITGNLSPSNAMVIFIDSKAGGAVDPMTGRVGSIGGQYTDDFGTDIEGSEYVNPTPGGGSRLPTGFNPDYAIEVNNNDGNGGLTYYVNVIDLHLVNDPPASGYDNRDVYLGSNDVNGSAVTSTYGRDMGLTSSGTITHAFNNTNTAGVNGYGDGDLGDPLSATTGFEFSFSEDFLGTTLDHIGLMSFITNEHGDYLSNQFLSGLGVGDNPGGASGPGDPLFDSDWFKDYGFSYVSIAVPEPGSLAIVSIASALLMRRSRRS